ncbi:hypothetical protein [Actinoplanes awajinensis]|uniref:Uncharacterized protein n=1 Tax=Actinoplanes awajinensis subsp. mycoplanecinus TaxID=135947 RepID=A0A101JI24_9ACTN|nr:hypothetical protein [Actinoplanes awajinensis]KUL27184.1 hypothetical protein ADL15_36415 [Actinoplanes awajinensis subsp. mycoplanecinus]
MEPLVLVSAVAALIIFVVLTELVAAAIPVLIVITLVPPAERADLARLLAAADSSRRLRLWPALRIATAARRRQRTR